MEDCVIKIRDDVTFRLEEMVFVERDSLDLRVCFKNGKSITLRNSDVTECKQVLEQIYKHCVAQLGIDE
jgi:hypothetical protein